MRALETFRNYYWRLLTGLAVFAFLSFGGYDWIAALVSNHRAAVAVKAAGPLPSFETRRTERLASSVHQNTVTLVTIQARRSDGAEVTIEENHINPERTWSQRHMVFPSSGTRIELDDDTRSKSTFQYRDKADPRFMAGMLMKHDPSQNCARMLDGSSPLPVAGSEQIFGLTVYRLERGGQGNLHTTWRAPDLGCVLVMTRSQWGAANGNVASVATAAPDYIRMGEPDPSSFAIPNDFVEMKPSDRQRKHWAFRGLTVSDRQ